MTAADVFTIETMNIRADEAGLLIARLTEELACRYHDDGAGDFRPADVEQPRSSFVLGRWAGKPVACGAFRPMTDEIAEIKRMYVDPAYRGRGVGRRLLEALENGAQEAGFLKIRLETGTGQPEAVGLYESAGYRRIAPYGMYREDPRSVCFEKIL